MKEMLLTAVFGFGFLSQLLLFFLYFYHLNFNRLAYLGGVMLVFAVLLGWRRRAAFETKCAASAYGSRLHTSRVVDTGIYGIVRQPMCLAFLLISSISALLSPYRLNTLPEVIAMAFLDYFMIHEELNSAAKFEGGFHLCMQQVPRMNFIFGLIRNLRLN